MTWHIVDARSVWIKEFALALARQVPVLPWTARVSWLGFAKPWPAAMTPGRPIATRSFPLQRGFARLPAPLQTLVAQRMARCIDDADGESGWSPLVLSTPHYAALARAWRGPSVYYSTDMFRYCYADQEGTERLEQQICAAVELVCPNSERIASYLREELGVPGDKIVVIPNATREDNVLPECATGPFPLPDDIADLPRPVAGVIGNLGANMDWLLLEEVVARAPWLSWAFVGPIDRFMEPSPQRNTRDRLLAGAGRVRSVGYKPYWGLADYARAVDVAVLPYMKREPTYSGSSTRFYEHLATCRPMLATRGFEELLHKEPLLKLVDDAAAMAVELERLRTASFRDGHEERRWRASRTETWEARAAAMRQALAARSDAAGKPQADSRSPAIVDHG